MKLLVNCDEVLEAVTGDCGRASADAAVAEHLAHCADCRQLAEAAAPAAELFAEELSPGRFAGRSVSTAQAVLARLQAEQTASVANCQRRSFLAMSPWAWSQLGAAAAILLALGGLFWAASPGTAARKNDLAALPAFASPLAAATEPTEFGLLQLASLRLPPKCLTTASVSPKAVALYQCCTGCHRAGEMVPKVRLVAFSQQTCAACHKS
jgi:hypothetical protein